MTRWHLSLTLDPTSKETLAARLAREIVAAIRRGRLCPGDKLPGTRTLARALEVSRNTVDAAYQELRAEGWISMAAGQGSFVSGDLPDMESLADPPSRPATLGFELPPVVASGFHDRLPIGTGVLRWDYGIPDSRLAPTRQLLRAYRRTLLRRPTAVLEYDRGTVSRLQIALAHMLRSTRGVAVEPEDVEVTHGSQMALYLVARALLRPGDVVAVEDPGYSGFWEVLRASGAEIVPVPVDDGGLRVDLLERIAASREVRAVYVTPHHQFPTAVTLTAGRRLELLRLARQHAFAVIEDDYDHEFHYDGRPVLPLASIDTGGVVLYVGSLAKIFAPGLRLGYLAAPRPFVERVRDLRPVIDLQGNRIHEIAMAELFEDGEAQRHWRRSVRTYRRRRDHLAARLREHLGSVLHFEVPAGGMAIWAQACGVDVEVWCRRAFENQLAFRTGARFDLEGRPSPFVRLGFARLDEDELDVAVDRLADAL